MYISKLFLNKNKITNLKRKYGRNNEGKITVRYRKKGHKRLIRFVNDNLNLDKNFIVISIEYNPYKNKFLNLVYNKKKNVVEKRYYEVNNQTNVLDILENNSNIDYNKPQISQHNSNITKISKLSIGDIICNIEKYPGKGPIFARSAGTFGQLIKFDNTTKNLAQVRLPSKEQYFINKDCFCVKGKNSNVFHKQLKK
jgi:large subunit ribosomal protein L2